MIEVVLFLVLVALGVSLRRAFVRIAELARESQSLRERLASLEGLPGVQAALGRASQQAPSRAPVAVAPSPAVPPERRVPPISPPVVTPPAVPSSAPTSAPDRPRSEGAVTSPEATRQPAAAVAARPAAHVQEPESLESQIATQWLLYIGVAAIIIGVGYFEKLAIERQYLSETARVIQGGVLGLVLIFGGLRFVRKGYAAYGQMISGGGAAILYLSTYAAFNFYHLIDRPIAFALMVGITAGVAWLADHLQSQGLALFAVGGGFATPFLLPGNTDAQIALFGYDTILVGGAMVLSSRRNWPALNLVSYLFTLLTVAGWADRFYTPDKYLRTEIFFTVFCAMFLYILQRCRKTSGGSAAMATMALWTAPLAYYIASWIVLQDHATAFLVWLVALMLVGGIVSDRMGTTAGFMVWIGVTIPLLMWAVVHPGVEWRVPGLATIGAVYTIALAAQVRHMLWGDGHGEMEPGDIAWLHLNGLFMFAGAYFLVSPTQDAATGPMAASFAVWQGIVAAVVAKRRRDQALHFGALGFTLLSIAIALQFNGPASTIGWAIEGAVVIALGLRERRTWLRAAGLVLLVVAIGRSLSLLATERAISEAVLFNPHAASAAVIVACCYVIAWLHFRRADAPDREAAIGAALVTAQVVTLALLTSEINAFWALREGHFARELAISVTWGVYATALIVVGLRRNYAPIRYFAMVVFAATILKVFVLDMAELDRVYRISSILGLGVLLLLTSFLYSRFGKTESIDDLSGRR